MPHYLKRCKYTLKKKKGNLFALTFIKSFHYQPQTFGLMVSNQLVSQRQLFQNLK